MKPVAIRKSRPVAVRKQSGPQLQYDMQGRPSFVFGAGGGGRGGGGRSKRERLLGAAGGLVGVLGGALTPTRSLGGLLGGMYAGGAQGSAVAGGLGRRLTGRRRQAQLDAREGRKQAEAEERGQLREDYRAAGGESNFARMRRTGKINLGRSREEEMRRFMREQDPGGKYDTPEAQAARATREKAEAYMQPENLQRLADQELMRQKIKLAAKAALETGGRPYVSPMSQEFGRRDAVEEMGPGAKQRAARVSAAREAGGPTSPAGQGNVIVTEQNEHAGEEYQGNPQTDYDHGRHGIADDLTPAQTRLEQVRGEMGMEPRSPPPQPTARTRLGLREEDIRRQMDDVTTEEIFGSG
tara:strand:- start:1992 stop:3053 length:1062 start_codon:yes stop_codon:yes gene_type:complete